MPSQAVLELLVNLKDNASSGLASLGNAVGTLGAVAGGVALAGVAGLGAAIASGVGDAREAAQIMAQTEAVIKSTGGAAGFTADQIGDMAGALSAASGKSLFGDSDIQQGQNLLLTFTNIKETLPDATQTMVDLAQAMGTDVKGGAIQLGKALNDPIAGISALSRVGVTFDESQKAVIKRLQESGDMAGAQKVILAELNKEFGGSAQAAAAADGGWAQFNDRMGEAKETLGAAVLPLLTMLVGVLNDRVMPVIEAGAQAFGNLVGYFSAVAEDGDTLNDFLANLPASIQPVVLALGALLALFTGSGDLGTVADTLSDILPPAIAFAIVDGIEAITIGFQLFQATFADLAQSFDEGGLIGLLNNLFLIVTGLPGPFNALAPVLDGLAASFSDGGLQGGIQFFIDTLAQISPGFALLKGAVDAALPPIQEIVLSVFGIITSFIQQNGAQMLADVTAIWSQIQGLIAALLPPIQSIVASVFGAIAAFLQANGADIQAFFTTTWNAIAEIVKTALAIIQAVVIPILTAVAGFIAAHGTEIQAVLKATWDYISGVITVALNLIQGLLKTVLLAINGDWSGAWAMLQQTSAQFVQGILDVVTKVLGDLQGVFNSAINAIQDAWDGLVSGASEIGSNIIQGIIQGVRDGAGALMGALTDMANDALQAAKDALGIASPSEVMANSVGAPLIQGIIVGMQETLPSLFNSLNQIALNVLGALDEKLNDETRKRIGSMIDSLVDKAKDVGASFNDVLASGFGAESSIDRQLAKNLAALSKVGDQAREFAASALNDAQKVAAQFADPATGAKYLKMRSDQVFELAKLQEQVANETDLREKARLQQQMNLIVAAQAAEQKAFGANVQGQTSPLQKIIDQINAVMKSADDLTNTSGVDITSNPVLQQLLAYRDQLLNGAGGFNMPTYTPLPAYSAAPGTTRDPNKGIPPGRVINNTFNLPPGTPRQMAEETIRLMNKSVNGRRG